MIASLNMQLFNRSPAILINNVLPGHKPSVKSISYPVPFISISFTVEPFFCVILLSSCGWFEQLLHRSTILSFAVSRKFLGSGV
jgi:hypothetical protein